MIIPHDQLRPQTLVALIEEFVTRDGALHGHVEAAMEQRVAAVMRQLRAGKAVVVFDEEDETASIVVKDSLGRATTDGE
jgi:uncharacterized protein YheU (UPF0270 family)